MVKLIEISSFIVSGTPIQLYKCWNEVKNEYKFVLTVSLTMVSNKWLKNVKSSFLNLLKLMKNNERTREKHDIHIVHGTQLRKKMS